MRALFDVKVAMVAIWICSFYPGTSPSYLMDILSPRLVGAVGARIYAGSLFL